MSGLSVYAMINRDNRFLGATECTVNLGDLVEVFLDHNQSGF